MSVDARLTEEQHASLDDGLKGHYRKDSDGSFVLDVNAVGGLELTDASGLKSALGKEKANAKELSAKYKTLSESVGDLNLDEARDALVKLAEMGDLDGSEKLQAELAAAKELLEKKFADDLGKKQAGWEKQAGDFKTKIGSLEGKLRDEMISAKALQAITAQGGNPKLLLPLINQRCRVEEEDGEYVVRVYDEAGNQMFTSQSGKSDPMDLPEFVTELAKSEDFAPAFKGANASGSGGGRGGKPRVSGGKIVITRDQAASGDYMEGLAKGTHVVAEG
jgi:hypothetical protein